MVNVQTFSKNHICYLDHILEIAITLSPYPVVVLAKISHMKLHVVCMWTRMAPKYIDWSTTFHFICAAFSFLSD